jgi:hypothetical protein
MTTNNLSCGNKFIPKFEVEADRMLAKDLLIHFTIGSVLLKTTITY